MVVHKLKLPSSRVQDTALVLVRSVRNAQTGATKQILHTLREDETPVDLQTRAVAQFNSVSDESGGLGTTAAGAAVPSQIHADDVVRWYFRDGRSLPLDLDHDASGSEASGDEDVARNPPWDLSHLSEDSCSRCAGFLLKQSARDPNLWRKRFCILAGNKLWYTKSRPQRSRGKLLAASSIVLEGVRVKETSSRVPFGFELQTVDRAFRFRAFGRHAKRDQLQQVQRGWLQALSGQIAFSDDNALMSMAELIISDSEGARVKSGARKLAASLSPKDGAEESGYFSRPRFVVGSRTRRTRFVLAVNEFREVACTRLPVGKVRAGCHT